MEDDLSCPLQLTSRPPCFRPCPGRLHSDTSATRPVDRELMVPVRPVTRLRWVPRVPVPPGRIPDGPWFYQSFLIQL